MANLINKQFSISLDEETLQKVEQIRFENKFDNRSMTISYLIELGLQSVKKDPSLLEDAPKKASRANKEEREAIKKALKELRQNET